MASSFPLTPGNTLDRSAPAPPIPPWPFKLHQPSITLPPISNLIQYTPSPLPRSGPVPTVLPVPPPANTNPTLPSLSPFQFDLLTRHDAFYPISSTPVAERLSASPPAPNPAPAM
ncbi:hypothetical protein L202_02293 [Cryptococcus amylolentus CBS 6039]|uniref:Uncharacterized protein n=2 Tax=Cryptococcus amylolentus TaxID=104669 RepID=A0A1E3I077_9TREE|nr:hypothetical protein L202_02293 [Cryptococcus amylolentus CBS 6039]ODN81957.1 hypothetical protein L202_02293 [Cryptococcus amylolentus CBS 6039]ODO09901.1 hypothetical protein I350_02123 [Cryptococcus amylolentus CBS 6273]